ncbi:MAG: sialate O-acetylesterase [Mariniphaga sp.]|nr:sialate O-acetylesterase [Mariniphaga sp.]
MTKPIFLLLLFFFLSVSSFADIKLPNLISDGIVLQRDTEINIWGWAEANERITLNFNSKNYRTRTDKSGKWSIILPQLKAGGPYEMIFKGQNEITIRNIMIGDVWVCSGQSNMTVPMERVKEIYSVEIASADYPEIRQYFIPTITNLNGPAKDLPPGVWKEAIPENIMDFSAIAYFFAKKIYDKHQIPIGILNTAVGGTPIEAWTSEQGFTEFPDILKTIERNKDTAFINSFKQRRPAPAPKTEPADKGLAESPKWYENDYRPKGWHPINIPGYWEDQGVKNLNGVVWYRREIEVPESMLGVPVKLFMGRIIDADFVYVNGQQVGNITYQYPPRRYVIPAGVLKQGKNIIVIRVINNGGKGGFVPDKPYFMTANDQEEVDLKGTWQYKVGEVYKPFNFGRGGGGFGFSAQNQPSALYNAMVAPMINLKIRGFLWYQGESNAGRPEPYRKLLPALITDWRNKWNNQELPFLYVQLANYMDVNYLPEESNWAELRDAQLNTLSVPNTAMAVAIDLGEWNDIHPLNKKDIGERLALGALKLSYGDDIVFSGPIYHSYSLEGNKIVLEFSNIGSGLVSNDNEKLRRFEIAGEDGKFVWAEAKIKGNTVEVWNEEIENPVQVRYAWSDNPRDANLYNKEGLPASPFRTDK